MLRGTEEDEEKYLGPTITENMDEEAEIKNRLASANRAYFSLAKITRSSLLSHAIKMKIYKCFVRPVAYYAWTLNKSHRRWTGGGSMY